MKYKVSTYLIGGMTMNSIEKLSFLYSFQQGSMDAKKEHMSDQSKYPFIG